MCMCMLVIRRTHTLCNSNCKGDTVIEIRLEELNRADHVNYKKNLSRAKFFNGEILSIWYISQPSYGHGRNRTCFFKHWYDFFIFEWFGAFFISFNLAQYARWTLKILPNFYSFWAKMCVFGNRISFLLIINLYNAIIMDKISF